MENTQMCRVMVNGKEVAYPAGTSFYEIAKDFEKDYAHAIILVNVDGKLTELFKCVKKDCTLSFVTIDSAIGHRTYERTLVYVMLKAFYKSVPREKIDRVQVMFSIDKGVYCEVEGDVKLTGELLQKVEEEMRRIVDADIRIRKNTIDTSEARELFHQYGMFDKERLLRYRQASKINVYDIDGFKDYYYGYMAYSTGIVKYFKLCLYEQGFVLQMPKKETPETVDDFTSQNKLFTVMKETDDWGKLMEVRTVSELNDQIVAGRASELVLVQEALQEKRIGDMADQIAQNPEKKFILVAGPSSSGKTSFANRLSIQLKAHGLKPHPISTDNYFVEREQTPRDENGNYDFESLQTMDLELLNHDLCALIEGEKVAMPTYNFVKGKREYHGDTMQMGENDVLVIEGIHCLNDQLTYRLDARNKFKIYISALTTLNLDEHNRIPTTDERLIRRMVRDARTRGASARDTIAMWPSVRRGEERNIFPYQESADCMFNSALLYELAVLKQYCEPLLYGIPKDVPEYAEAKRLLKFLHYFLGFGSDFLPRNSLIREFVGGSCFNV